MRNQRIAVYLEAADLATIDRIAREFGDLSRSAVAGVLIRQALAAIERGGSIVLGTRLVQPSPGETYRAQQEAIANGAFDPIVDPADGGHTADAYAAEFWDPTGTMPPPKEIRPEDLIGD